MRRMAMVALGILAIGVLMGCPASRPSAPPVEPDAGSASDAGMDVEGGDAVEDAPGEPDVPGDVEDEPPPVPERVRVLVRLDGVPTEGVRVVQGGATGREWFTGADGQVVVAIDAEVEGEILVLGSHPEARIKAADVVGAPEPVTIDLTRFEGDNPEYAFQDPGEPRRRNNTGQCGHCHLTLNDDWFASPHRTSAFNRPVLDLYSGTGIFRTEEDCAEAGGRWLEGPSPGTGEPAMRCFIGQGVLELLNPQCEGPPCEDQATAFGGCADCHAPGINGATGGRDLMEARGIAYDYGVSCNVCHQIEAVDLEAPPGVAGRLRIHRPSEPASPSLGANGLLPLTFGPSHDSPNPRMGSVQRDHFRDGKICAGCHQQEQPSLVPGVPLDAARWPTGALPVHTTYEEWRRGVLGRTTTCNDCHMPPAAEVANGADLQKFDLAEVGVQGGWHRPPGAVRHHSWVGPRQPESQMLQLAAAIFIKAPVVDESGVEVEVSVKNVACGHALPTGEPMRAVILVVEAACAGEPLEAIGGDAVPDFGGALDRQGPNSDRAIWPGARVGDVIRVVRRVGGFYDYVGFGAFGPGGGFSPEEKGMPVEHVAGASTVVAVEGDRVTLDRPLPEGEVAYRARPGEGEVAWAGHAGFAFAKVMAGQGGERMVPHFAAVDVVSDNRLMPQDAWTSRHRFARCPNPEIRARLIHRAWPLELAQERNWPMRDAIMTEVRR